MSEKPEKPEKQGFDPLKSLSNIRDTVARIFEDSLSAVSGSLALPIDIYETETSVIIKAGPLSGIEPEGIDVSFTGDTLTIHGETKPDTNLPDSAYIRRERRFGTFSRTLKITQPIKPDQAEADFRDGTLIITLPKTEQPEPKVINVRQAEGE